MEKVDEELIKGILNEATDVERYFAEMDRKKAAIMQELNWLLMVLDINNFILEEKYIIILLAYWLIDVIDVSA